MSPILIRAHYHPSPHTPMYPLLDLKSLLSFTSGGFGMTPPERLDTRTFTPSSVYMYFTLHGFLVWVWTKKSYDCTNTRAGWWLLSRYVSLTSRTHPSLGSTRATFETCSGASLGTRPPGNSPEGGNTLVCCRV